MTASSRMGDVVLNDAQQRHVGMLEDTLHEVERIARG